MMKKTKTLDCLIIGQNQIKFEDYEKDLRKMGLHSGAYRDLDKNTIQYNKRTFNASEIFNLFCCNEESAANPIKPIGLVETFSAAIAYLGTYLHRRGFTFDYIHSFQEEKKELAEKLERENIIAIAVVTTLYVSPLPILEIVDFIKAHNHTAKIVVGGPFVATKIRTLDAKNLDYLFKSIDADFYVNSSQGEAALVKLITALKNKLPLDQINNIYYRTDNGYGVTPVLTENNKLSENMVDWGLFAGKTGEFVNIRTGISCPFSCAFCGFPQHAGKYQTAPVEKIEKELNQLDNLGTVGSITFVDDTFNIPIRRFKEILRMMIKNNYKFKWNSFFRCQYSDREMVELMKESGCESIFLGLESGNNQILKNMNKDAVVEDYWEGIALFRESGIVTFGNFIIGFPCETIDTVQDTVEFIKKSGLDFYRAQLWYCEPITPIWREKEKYELRGESFEWSHKTMDSKTACDLIDELILSVENPARLPQYYFDYDNVMQLTYKGINIQQVKKYLDSFNNGVKEKLSNPSRKEVSYEMIKQIKMSCLEENNLQEFFRDKENKIGPGVEFDF
jgi:anaerobic magnesium-protoporphyrin IX monomethyl ester cyclase